MRSYYGSACDLGRLFGPDAAARLVDGDAVKDADYVTAPEVQAAFSGFTSLQVSIRNLVPDDIATTLTANYPYRVLALAVDSGRPLRNGAGEPVNVMSRWADTIGADSRVLLIVNSQPSRLDEIEQTIAAIAARTDVSRVSCIAPASLRSWLIQLGLSAANILPARLHGLDVDLVFFLENPRAIRWAAERNADSRARLGTIRAEQRRSEGRLRAACRGTALAPRFVCRSLPAR